jgi:hypothetical protein
MDELLVIIGKCLMFFGTDLVKCAVPQRID